MSDMVTTTRHGKVLEIPFARPPVHAIHPAPSQALPRTPPRIGALDSTTPRIPR